MRFAKPFALIVVALIALSALPRISFAQSEIVLQHAKLGVISEEIQRILDDIDGRLADAAKKLGRAGLAGPDAVSVLDGLCSEDPNFTSCAAVDPSGVIVTDRPERNKKYEGKKIGDQEHIKVLLTTQRPVMSSLFKAVEGYHAIEFGWPVSDRRGNFIGAVSVIVKPRDFLTKIIEPKFSWDAFTIWVLQTDGVTLFSKDRSLEGESLMDVVYYTKNFMYKPLIERIQNEHSGSMRYLKEATGRSAPKPRHIFWRSVKFRDGRWRVVLTGPAQ